MKESERGATPCPWCGAAVPVSRKSFPGLGEGGPLSKVRLRGHRPGDHRARGGPVARGRGGPRDVAKAVGGSGMGPGKGRRADRRGVDLTAQAGGTRLRPGDLGGAPVGTEEANART